MRANRLPGLLAILTLLSLTVEPLTATAEPPSSWAISGPGDVSAEIILQDGALSLVSRSGEQDVITAETLGLQTDQADLTEGLEFVEQSGRTVEDDYTMVTGKQRDRHVLMEESTLTFRSSADPTQQLDVIVRVAADGVAFRYHAGTDTTSAVTGEPTAFTVPADTTAWLQAESPSYENEHQEYDAADAPTGRYNLPDLFRVGDHYVHVTESDLDSGYSGARLTHQQGSSTYGLALSDATVAVDGAVTTPWRTMIIGDLATVTESTLTDDLAPQSRIADTEWIRPGPVAWSWLAGYGSLQKSLEGQQEFVDYAALHHWPYVLVDDGWKGTDWMPELVDYAAARGVKIMVWAHWTDLETAEEREALLDQVQQWGVVGLKIDFMDDDGQERLGWYDEILAETAERRLMINFHGTLTPRGLQRTWPHVITMEAVRGAEQGGGNTPVTHLLTQPFTRNVVGSMDFTPMNFQDDTIPVSDAAMVAMSVLYESGFQSYAGTLESYRDRPVAEAFLEQVPTVWDETRLLAGAPAEEAVLARRSGERWFVGAMSDAPRGTSRLDTSFLGDGQWLLDIVEDRGGKLRHRTRSVTAGDAVRIPVESDGGFAAVACPATDRRSSCYADVPRVPSAVLTVTPADTVDLEAGTDATVEVSADFAVGSEGTLTDVRVRPEAPAGWTVTGPDVTAAELVAGQRLRGTWTVTIPGSVEPGLDQIKVLATYAAPNSPAQGALSVQRQVDLRVAPPGAVWVSALPFAAETNGWGPVERDQSNGGDHEDDGQMISIGGRTFDTGLGAHAASEISIDLAGDYTRFTAEVGVDDEVIGDATPGTVTFQVLGDGKVLAETELITVGDQPVPLAVDVADVEQLTLRVTDGGDGKNADHASWGAAALTLS